MPVGGMNEIFTVGGGSVYFNPRAVPRAFLVSRCRTFSDNQEMLNWIGSPLFCPTGTVLLRDEELRRIPPDLRQGIQQESASIHVQDVSRRMAAEETAQHLTDPLARHYANVFRAPWGWSTGDEVSFRIHPDREISHCYLTIHFYPSPDEVSTLSIHLEGTERVDIPVELRGTSHRRSGPEHIVVDLGPMSSREYKVDLAKTAACSADIDSLTLSAEVPQETDAGSAEIESFEPNSLRVRVDAERTAVMVLSEIYYPGWEALLDGKPAPLLRADHVLRAVAVPRGQHTIELRYRPASLRWGLIITLLSVAGLTVVLFISRNV
jgi:hypothetical protein